MADIPVGIRVEGEDDGGQELLRNVRREIERLKQSEDKVAESSVKAEKGVGGLVQAAKGLLIFAVIASAVKKAVNALEDFGKRGVAANATIETATVNLAAMILLFEDLATSAGRAAEGAEAWGIAQSLAARQVRQLQIAGLKTTATTEQLVAAYKATAAQILPIGGSLDDVLGLTVKLVNAADAIGVPFGQLQREVSALATGQGLASSQLASALRLNQRQIVQARAAGTLVALLNSRLAQFEFIGDRVAETWASLGQQIGKAIDLVSAEATKPLFDSLRTAVRGALDEVFDFEGGGIAAKFQPLIRGLQSLFQAVGVSLASALRAGLDVVQRVGVYLDKNRESVKETVLSFIELVRQVGGVITGLLRMLAIVTANRISLGVITLTFQGWAYIIAGVRDTFDFLFAALQTGATAIASVLVFVGAILARTLVLPLKKVLDALALASVFIPSLGAGVAGSLAKAAGKLDDILKNMQDLGADLGASISGAQSPLDKLVKSWGEGNAAISVALKRTQDLRDEIDQANADAAVAENRARRAEDATLTARPGAETEADRKRREARLIAASEAALENVRSIVQRQRTILDEMLAKNLLSYERYYAELTRLQTLAADAEVAHLRNVLTFEEDPEKQAKIVAAIRKVEDEKLAIRRENAKAQLDAETALQERLGELQRRLLLLQGERAEVRRQELAAEFGDLLDRLQVEGDEAGAALVESIINIELAKARLDELQAVIARARSGLAARLEAIQTRVIAGALTERGARREVTAAYSEAATVLRRLLPELERVAAATKDEEAIAAVRALRTELLQMETAARQADQTFVRFGESVRDAVTRGLGTAFADILKQTRSVGDAFAEMARRVADAILDIAANLLAEIALRELLAAVKGTPAAEAEEVAAVQAAAPIVAAAGALTAAGGVVAGSAAPVTGAAGALTASAGLIAGSAAPLFGAAGALTAAAAAITAAAAALAAANAAGGAFLPFASGGQVPGAGHGDTVPALLTPSEFVIRADAVKRYGAGLFAALNAERLPPDLLHLLARSRVPGVVRARPGGRFAQGGLVGPAGDPSESLLRAEIGLEAGLVLKELETTEGERAVLRVITRNRKRVRGSIE